MTSSPPSSRLVRKILLAAFFSGAGVMMIELSAFRLVAPYFGSSLVVTTNILGIIMAALALGYWLGGKIADRLPYESTVGGLLIVNGVLSAAVPFLALPLFSSMVMVFSQSLTSGVASSATLLGSFFGALLLFFIPFSLLGMMSPILIRLSTEKVEDAGKTAGKIYAVSTVGSIIGTFLPSLFLIPTIGTRRTILLVGLMLVVSAILFTRRWWVWFSIAGLVTLLLSSPTSLLLSKGNVIDERESVYSFLRVFEEQDGLRYLQQDDPFNFQSSSLPASGRTRYYYDRVLPVAYASTSQNQRALIIGNAAGTLAKQLHTVLPDRTITVDGIEIDPVATELGAAYFDVTSDHGRVFHVDGRIALRDSAITGVDRYDIIILDAYHHASIPAHLATKEFFELVASRLTPEGYVVMNLNVTNDANPFYQHMLATYQSVFEHTYMIPVPNSLNREIYATNGSRTMTDIAEDLPSPFLDDLVDEIASHRNELPRSVASISTDDQPLTDVLSDFMILQYLFGGSAQSS